ncbi:MAG: pyrroline-5-carboxylate reductase [Actinomycetota bacterium]|nr:pyrroline-5-carboxylate reductase [Actinomycetota bacterium]
MQVGLIGAGNMASALARGWGDPVLCCDAGSGRARALAQELGGQACDSPSEVAQRCELVVLAHKPAQLAQIASEVAPASPAVASVLGGVSIKALQHVYPGMPVLRLMPNTPVEVRRGVTCLSAAPEVEDALVAQVVALFSRLGHVQPIPEALMETATAVMGVGPAYGALVAEAQVDAAIGHGMKPALAAQLVGETMSGTAALLEARGYDTLGIRREVTSPGGSTARGLAALERAGVRAAFQDAIDAVLGSGR